MTLSTREIENKLDVASEAILADAACAGATVVGHEDTTALATRKTMMHRTLNTRTILPMAPHIEDQDHELFLLTRGIDYRGTKFVRSVARIWTGWVMLAKLDRLSLES
jgi:hypothetical protein